MRVLLIRPPIPALTIGLKHIMICEPLELEYVAAGLVGHKVEIFDSILEKGLGRRLDSFRPDMVGTTCYINGVNEAKRICRFVKKRNPQCVTVVGGIQASQAPEDLADSSIDCIARTDGTTLISEIARAATAGHGYQDIPGLAIPSGDDSVVLTEEREYMTDPDSLPLPRRDLVRHLKNRYYYLFHQPVALVKTTWGCPYKCSFCYTWKITGGRVYSRGPESIVDEIEQIDIEDIYIVDDIFLMNPARLQKIAGLLRNRNIKKRFLVYGRSDFIAENEEIMKGWKELGLKAVIVGLEAATDEELRSMAKRCSVDHNRRAVEVLKRCGVDIYASLIPHPDYLPADWDRLQRFILENGIYYVNISPWTPFPGTDVWKEYENKLSVSRKAHALWDLTHPVIPTRMPIKRFYRSLIRVYSRTVLDIRRAHRLSSATMPAIWSRKYLRLWLGAFRIFLQLLTAHRQHRPRQLAKAESIGIAAPVEARFSGKKREVSKMFQEKSSSNAIKGARSPIGREHIERPTRPLDVFSGYFRINRDNQIALGGLTSTVAARRLFDLIRWGCENDAYTYQQPLDGKSGPYVSIGGRRFKMISSYDYLGLIGHSEIEQASIDAVTEYGTGTGGVRLLTGTNTLHHRLEEQIASFKGTEACMVCSSGYMANIGVISALLGPDDMVVADEKVHRSIHDACRLARVPVKTFTHNDPGALEAALRKSGGVRRTLIVVEGIYSMDGDICCLPEIVDLKNRYGAYLMVDEAHSFGVLGRTGRGVDEHFGMEPACVDIWMGSLSKAIPANGGFIAGSREMMISLQHQAAPYVFSAALSPAAAAAALQSIRVLRREPERLRKLSRNACDLRRGFQGMGFDTGRSMSPIIPVIIGSEEAAYRTSGALFKAGVIASSITFPAVKYGQSRLRICATAAQDKTFIDGILSDFERIKDEHIKARRRFRREPEQRSTK